MEAKEKSSPPAATAKGTAPSNCKYYSSLPPIFQVSDPQTKDEMKRGRAYDEGNQGEAYNPDYLYGGENYHKALSDVVSYVLRGCAGDGLSALSDVVVKVTNDPVRQFLDDILIRATWDVLPWQFVFDLYRRWFIRNNPSGRCQSRKSLINDVKGIISDYEGWDYSDNPVSVPDEMYDTPEGLIGIYEVREWEEPGYRGSNPNRSYLYRGSKRTRGLVRVGVAASEDATTTDSTIEEE